MGPSDPIIGSRLRTIVTEHRPTFIMRATVCSFLLAKNCTYSLTEILLLQSVNAEDDFLLKTTFCGFYKAL